MLGQPCRQQESGYSISHADSLGLVFEIGG